MIDEDFEQSNDYVISQNSTDDNVEERNIITDFSSPLKPEQEAIIDVSSPEVTSLKYIPSGKQHLKRKRRQSVKRNLDLRKRPNLAISISRKASPIVINKGIPKYISDSSNEEESETDDIVGEEEKSAECAPPLLLKNVEGPNSVVNSPAGLAAYICDSSNEEENETGGINVEQKGCAVYKSTVLPEIIEDNLEDATNSQVLQIEEDDSQEIVKSPDNISEASYKFSVTKENEIKEKQDLQQESPHVENENKADDLDCSSFVLKRAPKKGSLLEKALKVNSLMKKEAILYAYELKVGLRTGRGTFVSNMLTVENIYCAETYNLLQCVPQISSTVLKKNGRLDHVLVMVSKSVQGVSKNCCIVVHFPVNTMLDAFLNCHLVFAFERVQVISTNSSQLSLASFVKDEWNLTNITEQNKIFHTLKSRGGKSVLDSVLGHLLLHENTLQLEILHIYNARSSKGAFFSLLTVDSENQFCIVQVKHSDLLNLKIGNIYTFVGFRTTEIQDLSRKMKYITEYYCSGPTENEYIYILTSTSTKWSVTFLKKSEATRSSVLSTWSEVQQKFEESKRFKLSIVGTEIHKTKLYVREQSSNKFIQLNCEAQNTALSFPLKKKFLLEGVYLNKGFLCYDEFSRIDQESTLNFH